VNTAPGGDAMTARFHRDAESERLKREDVRRPIAWTIHPADAAECAAKGEHCQARRCRNPVAVVTWRWWRSTEAGRVLLAEHFTCTQHGQQFADRHHIEIEPTPAEPSRRHGPDAGHPPGGEQ
jgi:hypothetical protein